jgi:hypothetical protein
MSAGRIVSISSTGCGERRKNMVNVTFSGITSMMVKPSPSASVLHPCPLVARASIRCCGTRTGKGCPPYLVCLRDLRSMIPKADPEFDGWLSSPAAERQTPNAKRRTVNALGLPKRLSGLEVGLLSGEGNFPHVDDFCLVGPLHYYFLRIRSFEIS